MKAERRHELQHNELSDWAGDLMAAIQPYWRLIAGGAVLLVAVWLALGLSARRNERRSEQAWTQYIQALSDENVERLQEVAEQYPGTPASMWAFLRVGDASLAEGTQLQFEDRVAASEKLDAAISAFELVATRAEHPVLRQQATFGWAQALEASNRLKQAAEKYASIKRLWPESTIAALAEQRLKVLEEPDTAEFYAWFFKQQPRPATTPNTSLPGLDMLPNFPDLQVPPPADGGADATPPGVVPPPSAEELDLFGPGEAPSSAPADGAAPGDTETPAAENAESPAADNAETPAAGDAETPAAGDAETPAAGDAETPAAGNAETDDAASGAAPAENGN